MNATTDEIIQEREKQISKGFDATHDDQHRNGEIVTAVIGLLKEAYRPGSIFKVFKPHEWPWSDEDWARISRHAPRRILVICAAMMVAEIERFDRTTHPQLQ
jgi:hypothetical protein